MGLRITLDVFSGRANPAVELDDREAEPLVERLRPGVRVSEDSVVGLETSRLGYRGVYFEQTGTGTDELPGGFRLAGGRLLGVGLAHQPADPDLESYLLSADGPFAGTDVRDDLMELSRADSREMLERPYPPERPESWPPFFRRCVCGPVYEPAWWNVPARQPRNNCYNYACNYRTDTFAQPGRAASAMYTALTCDEVLKGAIADQLIAARDADNKCPDSGHLVALVIWPGADFHWYRKGRNGLWTHKPGGTPVTNLDNAGHPIADPRTADRGPYTEFCTFLVVMHGHIKIS